MLIYAKIVKIMSISLPSLASWIIFITIIVVGNSIIILYILGSHKLFVFDGLLGTCTRNTMMLVCDCLIADIHSIVD